MKSNRGFTLVELMVVVVIIGILAAIAIPNYQEYLRKARRSDAKSALLATAQAMERFYTENMKFSDASLGNASTNIAKAVSPEGYYTIAFDTSPASGTVCGAAGTTNSSAGAYRLCATPTGAQANDSCGTLSISQTGVKKPDNCW